MKRFLVSILALSLALSLAACGGDKPAPASSAAPAPSSSAASEAPKSASPASSKAAAPTVDAADAEYTPEQAAVAQAFLDAAARYDGVADKVNADPNLAEMQEVVTAMNEVAAAMIEADAVFNDPANLTAEVLAQVTDAVAQTNLFLDEIEAMLVNYGGKEVVVVPVEILNDTGVDIYGLAMSPANNENWGGNLLDSPLAANESGTTEMTFTADTLVWDLIAADSEGNTISFMGLDFSEADVNGAQLMLTTDADGNYFAGFEAR